MSVEAFFAYARERHSVHLKRSSGAPGPWTDDHVLQTYRFCNVFRELDRTTVWFRENVRERLREAPEVLLATVLFRLFNRIRTGEAIFCQPALGLGDESPGETAWDALLRTGDLGPVRAAILQYCSPGPYVTGSYIIKTPDGHSKLDGVLKIVEWFMREKKLLPWPKEEIPYVEMGWSEYARRLLENPGVFSLQDVWAWLVRFPYIGDFTAYEIVTDLRHTALLDRAPDVMTWANPGPGAKRGLGWVYGETGPRGWQIEKMRELLEMSRDARYWPQGIIDTPQWSCPPRRGVTFKGPVKGAHHKRVTTRSDRMDIPEDWPEWEMRDVEHTLCELWKYVRVREGGVAPRQRFRY